MLRLYILLVFSLLLALPLPAKEETKTSLKDTPPSSFNAFTGKVLRNKVRLRLQPSLEGKIIRELNKDDLLIVIGETEDFYIAKPPDEIKAYVFRTFVLDNVVEGKHVNVRLEPDLEAPIIGQLNSGDRVQGTISGVNNKWLEIAPPECAKFYVSKEMIEKIGEPGLKAAIQKRRDEVNNLLNNTYLLALEEIKKPFQEIQLEPIAAGYNKIITQYGDFAAQSSRAKELLASLQEAYLQKKLAYLEAKMQAPPPPAAPSPQPGAEKRQDQKKPSVMHAATPKAATWIPVEMEVYQQWAASQEDASIEDFYAQQKKEAVVLKGTIQPYSRVIRNRPGDHLLINSSTHLSTAYLYSTFIDLDSYEGKEVTLLAVARPNYHFAHPAYFVLSVE